MINQKNFAKMINVEISSISWFDHWFYIYIFNLKSMMIFLWNAFFLSRAVWSPGLVRKLLMCGGWIKQITGTSWRQITTIGKIPSSWMTAELRLTSVCRKLPPRFVYTYLIVYVTKIYCFLSNDYLSIYNVNKIYM